MDRKVLNTGIIGFGMAGRVFHAPFIGTMPEFFLKKISTAKTESAELAQKLYPQAEIVPNAQGILDDDDIELVIIGTPNTEHAPLARAALLRGKHVIVEKPFTVTSAEADDLIALAAQQNRVLTVQHNRRFVSDYRTVKRVIESQLLGNLVEYEAHYDRFRPALRPAAWREHDLPGAGILYDLGAHLIDQVLMLFGLPETVYADVRIQRLGGKVDDHFEIVLSYPTLKATLKASMLAKKPAPTFLLHGDQGSFVKYGMDVQEEALKAGRTPANTSNWGEEPENLWGQLVAEHKGLHINGTIQSERGAFQDFYSNVYRAIIGTEPLLVTAMQSRDVIRVIELAMESAKAGRVLHRGATSSDKMGTD